MVRNPQKRNPQLLEIAEKLSSAGLMADDALDTLEELVKHPEICEMVATILEVSDYGNVDEVKMIEVVRRNHE